MPVAHSASLEFQNCTMYRIATHSSQKAESMAFPTV